MLSVTIVIVTIVSVAGASDATPVSIDDIDQPVVDGPTTGPVCSVNGVEYSESEFDQAWSAAIESGQALVMLADHTITSEVTLTGNLSIDLNGSVLVFQLINVENEAVLTVTDNGEVRGALYGTDRGAVNLSSIYVDAGSSLILDGINYYSEGTAVYVRGDAASVDVVDNTVIHSWGYCISTNAATVDNYDVIINVDSSALYADERSGTAVLINVPGSLSINNCTVKGYMHGVVVRGGTAVITGSSITLEIDDDSLSDYFDNENWGSGNTINLGALVMGNKSTSYQYPTSVTITDSTVTVQGDAAGSYPVAYVYSNTRDGLGVDFVYEDTVFTNTGDSTNTIVYGNKEAGNISVNHPEAKIDGTGYATLDAAVLAAANGDTIVLQSDITDEPITIGQDKNIILDLSGFTLSASTDYTISNEGTLTIRDSSGSTGTITRSTDGIVIKNSGILTLESGKITRVSSTADTPNYIIESSGTLNITGGTVEAATSMSSLIRSIGKSGSPASINISGGEVHQTDGIIAVKNDDYSNLTVTGGTITCEYSGTDVAQAILNWSTANLKGGIINGSVVTWGYDDVQTDHTTVIDGPVTVNGSLYAMNYDSNETYPPQVMVSNGTISGQLYTRSGSSGDTVEPDAEWIQINGGIFSNPPENRFLADNYALTAVDGGYGVVPGFLVTVSITPAGVTPVITITAENMKYTYVEGLCLPNGEYKYSSTADGYYTTTGSFTVSDAGGNVSVTMVAEGQKIPVIIQYPSESGFKPVTIEVDLNTTLDVSMIPVEDGFRIDPDSLNGVGPITGPTTIDVNLILMSPTIQSFTVTYEDGVAYITVSATHPADGAVLMYSIGGTPYVTDNVLTVAESGTYTLAVGAILGSMSSETVATEDVIVTIPSGPDYPIIDDDDDYVPPIYVPSDTSSSDDDTVKIVACAAAAVVAVIMAAFLILGHRRE